MIRFTVPMLFLAATAVWPNSASAQAIRVARAAQAPRGGQSENRWRYTWHNDRWWYWTRDEHWSYFDGRRWLTYDPRQPLSGALAAGYRKAPAFESPPAAAPRPPRSWPAEGVERESAFIDFDLGGAGEPGAMRFGGGALPSVTRQSVGAPGASLSGREVGARTTAPARGTGGGAFGGPTGGSRGAGSAAGGASSPQ